MTRAACGTRRGFTLLEVIVAIAIAAMVLVAARTLAERLSEAALRLAAVSRGETAAANGERTLRAVIGQIELGADAASQFGGTAAAASFTSWCRVPAGWEERCAVTIRLEPAGGSTLVVVEPPATRVVVDTVRGRATLLYLSRADAGGTWIRQWGTGLTIPLAIAIATPSDTTLFQIGARG